MPPRTKRLTRSQSGQPTAAAAAKKKKATTTSNSKKRAAAKKDDEPTTPAAMAATAATTTAAPTDEAAAAAAAVNRSRSTCTVEELIALPPRKRIARGPRSAAATTSAAAAAKPKLQQLVEKDEATQTPSHPPSPALPAVVAPAEPTPDPTPAKREPSAVGVYLQSGNSNGDGKPLLRFTRLPPSDAAQAVDSFWAGVEGSDDGRLYVEDCVPAPYTTTGPEAEAQEEAALELTAERILQSLLWAGRKPSSSSSSSSSSTDGGSSSSSSSSRSSSSSGGDTAATMGFSMVKMEWTTGEGEEDPAARFQGRVLALIQTPSDGGKGSSSAHPADPSQAVLVPATTALHFFKLLYASQAAGGLPPASFSPETDAFLLLGPGLLRPRPIQVFVPSPPSLPPRIKALPYPPMAAASAPSAAGGPPSPGRHPPARRGVDGWSFLAELKRRGHLVDGDEKAGEAAYVWGEPQGWSNRSLKRYGRAFFEDYWRHGQPVPAHKAPDVCFFGDSCQRGRPSCRRAHPGDRDFVPGPLIRCRHGGACRIRSTFCAMNHDVELGMNTIKPDQPVSLCTK